MRHLQTVMGIPMSLDVRRCGLPRLELTDLVSRVFAVLEADDLRFSTYRHDSEVSRINAGDLLMADASAELTEVRVIAEEAERASAGSFRCRTPHGALDLNGVVKGWSVQRACRLLVATGVADFCFNAGGDVAVCGRAEPGRPWHVAVRSPFDQSALAVLALSDAAAATSGLYERDAHLWDGRTGQTPTGLASVTVVAGDLNVADVLATSIFAMGADGVAWAVARYDCAVLACTPTGRLIGGGDIGARLARPIAP